MSTKQQEIEAIRGEIVRIEANQRKAMDRCEYLAAVASWTSLVAESGVALREREELSALRLKIIHRESRANRLAEAKEKLRNQTSCLVMRYQEIVVPGPTALAELEESPIERSIRGIVEAQLAINAIEAE